MRYFCLFFLLFVSISSAANLTSDILEERFDVIEINHFYDDKDELIFTQMLFREYDPNLNRFKLQAWRMMKSSNKVKLTEQQAIEFKKSIAHLDESIQYKLLIKNSLKDDMRKYFPTKERDDYVFMFEDGEVTRKIRTKSIKETFTTSDPELEDREFWPKEKRRELMRPLKKKVIPPPSPLAPNQTEEAFFRT